MKIFKIWSLVLLLAVAMTSCEPVNGPNTPGVGSFDAIEKEWKLVSVDGVKNDFTVYIKFEGGLFAIYQQVYSWNYVFYEGQYSIDGGVLSGSYFDGGDWKTPYTGGVSEDGKYLTLISKETTPVTYIYEACTIPEDIKTEATGTRAEEVVPFL